MQEKARNRGSGLSSLPAMAVVAVAIIRPTVIGVRPSVICRPVGTGISVIAVAWSISVPVAGPVGAVRPGGDGTGGQTKTDTRPPTQASCLGRSRYRGAAPIEKKAHGLFVPQLPPLSLDDNTRKFLTDVVAFLGRLNAFELSEATHKEAPWNETRGDLEPRQYSSEVIQKTAMRTFFSALIEEGENALSRRALMADLPSPRWGWSFVAGICARRMVTHPFYFHGLSLWGAESRLGDGPSPRPAVDPTLYKPLSRNQAEDVESFTSVADFIASIKAQ